MGADAAVVAAMVSDIHHCGPGPHRVAGIIDSRLHHNQIKGPLVGEKNATGSGIHLDIDDTRERGKLGRNSALAVLAGHPVHPELELGHDYSS
ncbi:hypothetical protein CZ774_09520 [Frigoribacterium sp. JB110]|nr:hypothetical protein CZ774_09520 [Frigoribacterium sp. JB110]